MISKFKNMLVITLIFFFIISYTFNLDIHAKDIDISIKSVNKKQIKIQVINNSNKNYYTDEYFILKKKCKKKWKKVKFKKNAMFARTITYFAHDKVVQTFKWKRFFKKKPKKGKYKFVWFKSKFKDNVFVLK